MIPAELSGAWEGGEGTCVYVISQSRVFLYGGDGVNLSPCFGVWGLPQRGSVSRGGRAPLPHRKPPPVGGMSRASRRVLVLGGFGVRGLAPDSSGFGGLPPTGRLRLVLSRGLAHDWTLASGS